MEEEEDRPVLLIDPLLGHADRLATVALNASDDLRRTDRLDLVVVEVESAGDSRVAPKNERRDGSSGRVPILLQQRRQRWDRVGELEADVVAHAMIRGQESGEHGQVRWQRERAVAVGATIEDRVGAQGIEIRRLHRVVAV